MINSGLTVQNAKHVAQCSPYICCNCGPRLEVIVVGTQKPVIQWKARARAQSAAEIQSWAPALFSRFCARERKAIKKSAGAQRKKARKKAKAPSAKEKKTRIRAFFFFGGHLYVCMYFCMYVFKDVHMYVGM